jgi:hypothetical protein
MTIGQVTRARLGWQAACRDSVSRGDDSDARCWFARELLNRTSDLIPVATFDDIRRWVGDARRLVCDRGGGIFGQYNNVGSLGSKFLKLCHARNAHAFGWCG